MKNINLFEIPFAGSSKDDDVERTLAIIIGLVAGVAVMIVFLSFLSKLCDKKGTCMSYTTPFYFLCKFHSTNSFEELKKC